LSHYYWHTAPGLDYTLAYWFGVYFGLLPGDGPYDDFAFYLPPNWSDDDDDTTDDDDSTADDDVSDDDTMDDDSDDDTMNDDAMDDNAVNDDNDDGCGY